MRHRGGLAAAVIILAVLFVAAFGVAHANISALPEPGVFETTLAMKARDWYIRRAARGVLPPVPSKTAASVAAGRTLFGMDCASCHGLNGRTPTPIGKAMYPRVSSLRSHEVQQMSDRELFWVIKNGIRLSGMPGFAHIDNDEQIWQLTYYMRSLDVHTKSSP